MLLEFFMIALPVTFFSALIFSLGIFLIENSINKLFKKDYNFTLLYIVVIWLAMALYHFTYHNNDFYGLLAWQILILGIIIRFISAIIVLFTRKKIKRDY